jgi:hypothetical protein
MIARVLAALCMALVGAVFGLVLPALWTLSALLGPGAAWLARGVARGAHRPYRSDSTST